ncbi:unnamed protein product [Rotaria sp. Silwood1]|nr:unnamed protein product [Rotaria sp. Silwood1]CAF1530639.1 unnamed protein product [Rotaria sp. Silwood1]
MKFFVLMQMDYTSDGSVVISNLVQDIVLRVLNKHNGNVPNCISDSKQLLENNSFFMNHQLLLNNLSLIINNTHCFSDLSLSYSNFLSSNTKFSSIISNYHTESIDCI